MANTERENIDLIQDCLGKIKKAAQEEIAKAKAAGNPRLLNAWGGTFHKTGVLHFELTNLLFENFPEFAGDVVINPQFGGR